MKVHRIRRRAGARPRHVRRPSVAPLAASGRPRPRRDRRRRRQCTPAPRGPSGRTRRSRSGRRTTARRPRSISNAQKMPFRGSGNSRVVIQRHCAARACRAYIPARWSERPHRSLSVESQAGSGVSKTRCTCAPSRTGTSRSARHRIASVLSQTREVYGLTFVQSSDDSEGVSEARDAVELLTDKNQVAGRFNGGLRGLRTCDRPAQRSTSRSLGGAPLTGSPMAWHGSPQAIA
jgi:hypothetical protein